MARGKPDLNGAPRSSGTPRPAGTYTNTQGPGAFKGQTKKLAESSGTLRSTGPGHRQALARERQAGEGIAGDLKASWKGKGGSSTFEGPPRAASGGSSTIRQNELGNAHGAGDTFSAPPKAR